MTKPNGIFKQLNKLRAKQKFEKNCMQSKLSVDFLLGIELCKKAALCKKLNKKVVNREI